jgi:hypothetical protein
VTVQAEVRIIGATVLAAPGTVFADAEIAVSPMTGLITYLGPQRGPAGPMDIDATGRIVAPGLINGHTHAGISLLRGHSDDEPLQQWLTHIRAFEVRMTRDDIRAGLLLSMAEMICRTEAMPSASAGRRTAMMQTARMSCTRSFIRSSSSATSSAIPGSLK